VKSRTTQITRYRDGLLVRKILFERSKRRNEKKDTPAEGKRKRAGGEEKHPNQSRDNWKLRLSIRGEREKEGRKKV